MMSMNTAILSIGITVVSFLGGMVFYYVIDTGDKKEKKYQLDQFLNVLIQFILYLWAAKVLLQISRFVHDPISVLAYPANAMHLVIATVFLFVHLWIKYRKSLQNAAVLFQVSSFILLVSLFLYDIFQVMATVGTQFDITTIVLAILVIIYVLGYAKYNLQWLSVGLIGGYFIFASIMAFYKGYYLLFRFMISPYVYLLLLVGLLIYVYRLSKHK